MGGKKPGFPWDPKHGREILEELLEEVEALEELERINKLTPEQRDEELRRDGWEPGLAERLLERARAQADAQARQGDELPDLSLEEQLHEVLDRAWVKRIGAMTPAQIKELAAGRSLTDEQIEAILRRAKARMGESGSSEEMS